MSTCDNLQKSILKKFVKVSSYRHNCCYGNALKNLVVDLARFKAWRFISSYDETAENMTKRRKTVYNEKI